MPVSVEQINEKVDEISKLVSNFQEVHKGVDERGEKTTQGLEDLKVDFAKTSQEYEDMRNELDGEKKAREELELSMARLAATGGGTKESELSDPEYEKAYKNYFRKYQAIPDDIQQKEIDRVFKFYGLDGLTSDEKASVKMHLVGSDPSGGYMVPVDRLSRITKRLFETSAMRGIATIQTTGTEAVEIPLDDGLYTSRKVSELEERTETDTSEVGIITIPVHEQQAEPQATQKMLDDATFNVESYIMNKLNQIFMLTENNEFVNGSGNKEARGFLDYDAWAAQGVYERDALEDRVTAAVDEVTGDELIDLQSDLLEQYQGNAVWTTHRKIWAEVLKLKDQNDQYLLNPAMLFSGALGMQLLGNPVKLFGDMPSTLAAETYIMAYGDFREGYMIVDRMGMRMLRDPYTKKGFMKFYTTKRTGGDVINYQAIKRLKTATQA